MIARSSRVGVALVASSSMHIFCEAARLTKLDGYSAFNEASAAKLVFEEDDKGEELSPEAKGIAMDDVRTMIAMATNVYSDPPKPVDGWTLSKFLHADLLKRQRQSDNIAVYTNDGKCAIAFSGSDDLGDWIANFKFYSEQIPGCKMENVHGGYYWELHSILSNPGWKDIESFLSNSCPAGVISVGHSLGGAIASIFAGCASVSNGKPIKYYSPKKQGKGGTYMKSITITLPAVRELYTIGACAPGKQQIKCAVCKDGRFAGARVVNEDAGGYDPGPYFSLFMGFNHPRVQTIRFNMASGEVVATVPACGPGDVCSLYITTRKSINFMLHKTSEYIQRCSAYLGVPTRSPVTPSSEHLSHPM